MKLFVYAMYDRLEGAHRSLVTSRSDARAARDFCNEMKRFKDSMAQKMPVDLNDYELHKLAEFEDESGVLIPLSHYEVIPLTYAKEETN